MLAVANGDNSVSVCLNTLADGQALPMFQVDFGKGGTWLSQYPRRWAGSSDSGCHEETWSHLQMVSIPSQMGRLFRCVEVQILSGAPLIVSIPSQMGRLFRCTPTVTTTTTAPSLNTLADGQALPMATATATAGNMSKSQYPRRWAGSSDERRSGSGC